MSQVNVLITGALQDAAIEAFKSNKKFAVTYEPDCPRKKLFDLIGDVQVLVTRSETAVDQELIDRAEKLNVVARAAVGVGNIDVDYATSKGILVINTPGKNTNSAAELTMGLVLSMLRNIPAAYGHLKAGGWDRHRFAGIELKDKKIGIVGLGNVGHRVAKFAHGFDMKVFGYDPYISPELFRRYGVAQVESLKEMASQVDILTVHVPLNNETCGMVSADVIKAMPNKAYLVNAARGGVIAEEAILESLKSGQLSAVALDTFENEPQPRRDLVEHENVWCTQHIGASTHEAQVAIGKAVYEQVCKAVDGGVVDFPVNLPDVGVPDSNLLKSYSVLAQKLGSMIGQIIDFNPTDMELQYRGDLAGEDTSLIRLGLMKGYAGHVVDEYVSFVNTTTHFEKLGVVLTERQDPDFSSYKSALKIVVRGDSQTSLSVGGIVFDDTVIRISLLNEFYFEIEATGHLLLMENHDRPGVIGDVGQYLSQEGINIDNFNLSRNREGGKAMAVIRTDSEITDQQLDGMRLIKNVVSAKTVRL